MAADDDENDKYAPTSFADAFFIILALGAVCVAASGWFYEGPPVVNPKGWWFDSDGLPWNRPSKSTLMKDFTASQSEWSQGPRAFTIDDIISFEVDGWQILGDPNAGSTRWAVRVNAQVAIRGAAAQKLAVILRYDTTMSLPEIPDDPMFLTHKPNLLDWVAPGLFMDDPDPDLVRLQRLQWRTKNRMATWLFVDCTVVK